MSARGEGGRVSHCLVPRVGRPRGAGRCAGGRTGDGGGRRGPPSVASCVRWDLGWTSVHAPAQPFSGHSARLSWGVIRRSGASEPGYHLGGGGRGACRKLIVARAFRASAAGRAGVDWWRADMALGPPLGVGMRGHGQRVARGDFGFAGRSEFFPLSLLKTHRAGQSETLEKILAWLRGFFGGGGEV